MIQNTEVETVDVVGQKVRDKRAKFSEIFSRGSVLKLGPPRLYSAYQRNEAQLFGNFTCDFIRTEWSNRNDQVPLNSE